MRDQAMFDAINESQDGRPLRRFILDNEGVGWELLSVTEALNALLVLAWRQAADAEQLATHLSYVYRELRQARNAVEKETTDAS